MKIVDKVYFQQKGSFSKSAECKKILWEIDDAISHVVWPVGSKKFEIYPGKKGNKKKGIPDTSNGVKPIKDAFVKALVSKYGWKPEAKLDLATRKKPGPIDIAKCLKDGRHFAVEWETGNVSSSHRALNKMAIGVMNGKLAGGLLVVPTRDLYRHLTDRVGNVSELEPYFQLWERLPITDGILGLVVIEHDATSTSVERITKGTDGWALLSSV